MSTAASPSADFPSGDTAPKAPYPPASMVTPIPRLPKENDNAKNFGRGAIVTAVAGVIFQAVKELGGIPATAAWLKGLSFNTFLYLTLILAIVALYLLGKQFLSVMQDRIQDHDQQIVAGVNRIGLEQAIQRGKLDDHGERIGVIDDKVDALRETVDLIAANIPEPAQSVGRVRDPEDTAPPARPRRRRDTAGHEILTPNPDETETGRHRRLGKRS